MTEFAQITGELLDNRLKVRVRTGNEFFAPMVITGTTGTLPSAKWLSENKDKFLALVTYEKDLYLSPMITGFYPLESASSASYDIQERLLAVCTELLEQLLKAKVNTMLGPQPFMPDTIQVFNDLKARLDEIKELILPIGDAQ